MFSKISRGRGTGAGAYCLVGGPPRRWNTVEIRQHVISADDGMCHDGRRFQILRPFEMTNYDLHGLIDSVVIDISEWFADFTARSLGCGWRDMTGFPTANGIPQSYSTQPD